MSTEIIHKSNSIKYLLLHVSLFMTEKNNVFDWMVFCLEIKLIYIYVVWWHTFAPYMKVIRLILQKAELYKFYMHV